MMHGPLNEIGLIEVLQLLERGRRSGVLRLAGVAPAAPCELHLRDGMIVALSPAADDASTRRALVARALVSEAEAADDPSVLTRPVAVRLREQLAVQALAAMLHWRRGRFDFSATPVEGGPLALSPDALVLDIVAAESRRVDLAPALDDFRAIPDYRVSLPLDAPPLPALSPREWRLLDHVDGVRDVAALAAVLDEPVEDVAGSVQALQAALILELRQPAPDADRTARVALEAGRYDEAAELLRARLTNHPEDGDAWRALGLAEIGAGRFELAIDAWQSWRTHDPQGGEAATTLLEAARTMVEALRDARD